MFHSLRFRLPALFLAGIVLAGILSALIAAKLFQDYTRDRKFAELHREARGLAQLYGEQALSRAVFSSKSLSIATGDTLFYSGLRLFGPEARLRQLPATYVEPTIKQGKVVEFTFTPPGDRERYYAVAQPVKVGKQPFGDRKSVV